MARTSENDGELVILTFEQKRKLATTLQALPVGKQFKALQLIMPKGRTSDMEDEYEVDLDKMDHATLIALYEYCCGTLQPRAMSMCRAIMPHTSACKPTPAHDESSDSDSSSSDSDDNATEEDCTGAGSGGVTGHDFSGSAFVMPLLPCMPDTRSL
jgi:hypothetical protein